MRWIAVTLLYSPIMTTAENEMKQDSVGKMRTDVYKRQA